MIIIMKLEKECLSSNEVMSYSRERELSGTSLSLGFGVP
jgi:hypothetical protein